jgi:hypothetical protein
VWFGRGGSGSLRMRCRWNCERACRLGQVESGRRERGWEWCAEIGRVDESGI